MWLWASSLLQKIDWGILLGVVIGAVVTYAIMADIQASRIADLDAAHAKAIKDQETALNDQCAKNKQLTTEVSNDYQSQLTDLRRQLAAVKRVQPNRCIVPTPAKPTGGRDAAAANQELPHTDGVYTDDLFDFAADAEQVGRQLDACQSFITKTWQARGQ